MNARERKAFQELKAKFIDFMKNTSVKSGAHREMVWLSRIYGSNLALLGWKMAPYKQAIEATKKLCPQVSEKTIAGALQERMLQIFETQFVEERKEEVGPEQEVDLDSIASVLDLSGIDTELSDMIELLRSKIEKFQAFIPLTGVRLGLDEVKLGDFTLYPPGAGPLYQTLHGLRDDFTEELKRSFSQIHCYVMISELEGDSEYVKEKTIWKAQDVVDILDFYLASCRDRQRGYHPINVQGQLRILDRIAVYVSSPSGQRSVNLTNPYTLLYEIHEDTIADWQRRNLAKVIDCFRDDNLATTIVRSKIRRATQWYSRAVQASTAPEQFINFSTALEALLIGEGEGTSLEEKYGSITQKLGDRTAFLLGESFEHRKNLAKRVRRLYNLRSSIVHQGTSIDQASLDEMDSLVYMTIHAFIEKDFESWEKAEDALNSFLVWLEKQVYGTGEYAVSKGIPPGTM
jgi:archaellin